MGDTVAGISLPPGNPGAIEDAAQGLKKVASGFGQAGDTARAAASSVSWTGTASEAFGARTGDYEDAGRKADAATMQAVGVLTRFAKRLEEGIDRVTRLQDRALDAKQRMEAATREAVAAGIREGAARTRAAAITVTDLLDVTGSSLADQSAALQEADDAAAERVKYEGIADRARDELEQLREEAREEREAVKDAATAAAGELNGAQDGLPILYHGGMYGTAGGMEDRVLTGVRNGDYSVLEGLSMDTLDEDTQQAVGGEIAKDADQAVYGEGDKSFSEVTDVVDRFGHDGDFAVGFYNQLGGAGTSSLASSIVMFQGTGEGLDDPALIALMAPYANMLGTATRSGGLRRGFTNGFLRRDTSVRDRFGNLAHLKTFVMAGESSNYSPRFLSEVGEEVLITPNANPDDGLGMAHELSDHQDLMEFIAENPEAAGQLLAGNHGLEDHISNAAPLMMYGPRYQDDGAALGSLIEAGTSSDPRLERPTQLAASEAVIRSTPAFADHMPDGAQPALVNVLEEHIVGFEHAAADEANPTRNYERGDNIDISYGEGRDYIASLMGFGDEHEFRTLSIVGAQVEQGIYDGTEFAQGTDKRNLPLERAGALEEMTTQAGIKADISEAEGEAAANEIKGMIAGHAIDAAGGKVLERIPGAGLVIDQATGAVFPTDQVEHALHRAREAELDADDRINFLILSGEVHHGRIPPEAITAQDLIGGTDGFDLTGDGDEDDVVTRFDRDGDGHRERLTETDLRNLVQGRLNDEPSAGPMKALREIQTAVDNPAEWGDFKDDLPDGYQVDGNWIFDDKIYNEHGNEVDYEITRDRAEWVLTLKDPDASDVQVRVTREGQEWVVDP